ncbi:SRPBCC family protein [Actinomycetospora straminea]|uniref:SRPBCC family protein n=1 Tax=Actinomycetospora straminea TaxID=663607 RepID=A0ABP9E8X3_9PSEU|nr:SRPBCC family protein [Actinomycetospora straminea]MDD7932797.1 SRPBCC family protein [Actinomycetospora straminea]
MPETRSSTVIPADVDAVWRVVRDFDSLPAWVPAVAACRLDGDVPADQVGAVRRLALDGDGGTVVEQLVALDDRERTLTYAILESPFPVQDYRATIRVFPVTSSGECFVSWSVLFDCDPGDAERLMAFFSRDVFASGLEGLAAHLSSAA